MLSYIKNTLFITIAITLLTGCATVISGTSQNVNLQAISSENNEELEGVTCTIRDSNGMVYSMPSNPGSINIKKGQGALMPQCKKDGYKQISYGIGDSFDAITLVNVVFWPGFIVDAVTGSMNKYPSHITIVMKPAQS